MRKILQTTAMMAALGFGTAFAETATNNDSYGVDISVPEGFERQEAILTTEDLLNATVYDARGDAVGEIEDLVLSSHNTGMTEGQTGTGTVDQTGKSDMSTNITTGTDGTTTTGTDGNATAQGQTGTATGTKDMADGMADNSTAVTGDGNANDARVGESVEGEVTHAVIDVGGFLGMGERRVALPIADLVVYRSNAEMRVYLPWTEEQLEQLPVYNVNDPATLGTAQRPMTN